MQYKIYNIGPEKVKWCNENKMRKNNGNLKMANSSIINQSPLQTVEKIVKYFFSLEKILLGLVGPAEKCWRSRLKQYFLFRTILLNLNEKRAYMI